MSAVIDRPALTVEDVADQEHFRLGPNPHRDRRVEWAPKYSENFGVHYGLSRRTGDVGTPILAAGGWWGGQNLPVGSLARF
jgi:hypothetical protein